MFKVTVTTAGVKPRQFIGKINAKVQDIEEGLVKLGDETVNHIRHVINTSKKRESDTHSDKYHKFTRDNLALSMQKKINYSGDRTHIGVGYIPDLEKFAPYWKVVNYGGYVPPAVRGFFSGGSSPLASMKGTGTQAFYPDSKGFLMVPKSPIRPMNYIQTTHNWLKSYWKSFWSTRLRKKAI